jgi:uncharacterized protein (TIGR02145 family)
MKKKNFCKISVCLFSIFIFFSCERSTIQNQVNIPEVVTSEVTEITETTANCGGNINSDGGADVTVKGVCWSINSNPIIADNMTIEGTGTGSFTSTITGLVENTTYNVRAYATNSAGTGYGNAVTFTTSTTTENTVTDIDGNVYRTIRIANQVWMAENLTTTKYNDGVIIPHIIDDVAWGNLSTPGYCFYNNDTVNIDGHGAIYNWYAINTGKLAPLGWHIPTKTEFETLIAAVNNNGNALKAVGQGTGSGTGTNTSGFSALLSGCRVGGLSFFNRDYNTYFWSSNEFSAAEAHTMNLNYLDSNINPMVKYKNEGFSVRCIKD